MIAISLGALFRESRYRWGALLLLAVAIVQAFTYVRHLSPTLQVLSFGASAVVLLVVSWAYSRNRQKTRRQREHTKGSPQDKAPPS